ncbi:hypothetical protein [Streptomyces sp. NPDC014734]|uniref:hypothetical protein n=1 Tax=Streptomyces sp. NPDC014734 TaxID=3364886 RepID=UPI0036F7E8F6
MTTTPRPRFSVRVGLAEPEFDGPFEGIPPHLTGPLQKWVEQALFIGGGRYDEDTAQLLCVRMRIPVLREHAGLFPYTKTLTSSTGDNLLDIVDALLGYYFEVETDGPVEALDLLLSNGGSVYRVTDMEDGLEERVAPAVRDAVRQTIVEAADQQCVGSAADHLEAAWKAAYGRGPDAVRAYSEAIKAVESAAHAVIQPNNAKATLGTMLGEIRNARHKFTAAIPTPVGGDPIAPAEAMMRTLWEGQTSRHGARTATVPETLEAARAGVHLAAALVQWFVSGAVVRTP